MEYIELTIALRPRDPWAEILVADLAENGYESFVETEEGILAYGREGDVDFSAPLKNTLLADKELVPELLQEKCNPIDIGEALYQATLVQNKSAWTKEIKQQLAKLQVGKEIPSQLAAKEVLNYCSRNSTRPVDK